MTDFFGKSLYHKTYQIQHTDIWISVVGIWCKFSLLLVLEKIGIRKYIKYAELNSYSYCTIYFIYEIVGSKAKGRISKWVFQENKAHQIFQKTKFSYPLGVRTFCFSENLACLVLLKRPFWDSPFRLITNKIKHLQGFHCSMYHQKQAKMFLKKQSIWAHCKYDVHLHFIIYILKMCIFKVV